jgi:hypothetical protein
VRQGQFIVADANTFIKIKENRLQMFENRMLRRIFGPMREEE